MDNRSPIHKKTAFDKLQFGIGDLARMTGVSTTTALLGKTRLR